MTIAITVRRVGRVTFPQLHNTLRTNDSFRQLSQLHDHKNGPTSIVVDLLDDVVGDVCLDYLHLVCIGVHKKLVLIWISDPFDNRRISKEAIAGMSNFWLITGKYFNNCQVILLENQEQLRTSHVAKPLNFGLISFTSGLLNIRSISLKVTTIILFCFM